MRSGRYLDKLTTRLHCVRAKAGSAPKQMVFDRVFGNISPHPSPGRLSFRRRPAPVGALRNPPERETHRSSTTLVAQLDFPVSSSGGVAPLHRIQLCPPRFLFQTTRHEVRFPITPCWPDMSQSMSRVLAIGRRSLFCQHLPIDETRQPLERLPRPSKPKCGGASSN